MIEINIRSFLGEFNGSKFVVYFFLLIFSLLLSIRLDKIITVNYAIIFIPLWLGEACVFLGFIIGFASFISHPPSRTDIVSRGDFFAMCFQTLEHILLTMFQLMVYLKLEHYYTGKEKAELNWLLVFSPLFVQSFMAMIIAIWCIRHEKPFEFEMFFSVNIIQFVFLAFKLDNGIHWSWALVLVPTWILFSLFLLCSIYSLTIALFLNRHFYAHQHTPPNRRPRLCASICHVVLSIPLLLHLLLLAGKLDALESTSSQSPSAQTSFLVIGLPLMVSLLILLLLSFGSRSGNIWWFGMRQPFCNFVFELFPCLQYYANISCKFGDRRTQNDQQSMNGQQQRQERRSRHRQNHNQYPQSVGPNNSNVRIYGVEEPSSSWMVSTLEEQRIILDETEPELCEIQAHHQSRGNNNKQEKQKHNRNNKDKLIAYLTVRSSIESPD